MRSTALLLGIAALMAAQDRRATNGQIVPQAPRQPTSFDCSIDGMVTNAVTGEPIPRARIVLNSAGTAYGAASDSAGKWTLTNVACGPGQINASRPGFLQAGTGGSQVRARAAIPFQPVNLVSGSPVHDMRMQLTPQAVVLGKVLDDQGDPIMGAQVSVLTSRVVDGRARFQPAGQGMTNDLGEYRIANLPRGRYILCARAIQNSGPLPANAQTM